MVGLHRIRLHSVHLFKDPNHGLFRRITGISDHIIPVLRLVAAITYSLPPVIGIYLLRQTHTCGQTVTF